MFFLIFLLKTTNEESFSLKIQKDEESIPNLCENLYENIRCLYNQQKYSLTIIGEGSFTKIFYFDYELIYSIYINATKNGLSIETQAFNSKSETKSLVLTISGPVYLKKEAFDDNFRIQNLNIIGDDAIFDDYWYNNSISTLSLYPEKEIIKKLPLPIHFNNFWVTCKNEEVELILPPLFTNITSLRSISLDNSRITIIEDYAFQNCRSLSLDYNSLPDTLKKIGKYAFQGIEFTSFSLPSTLEEIGEGCFKDTKCVLSEIDFSETKITHLADSLFENSEIVTVHLSNLTTSIGACCFKNNKEFNLEIIGFGLEELGDSAFENCEIQNIPESTKLVRIGNSCFRNCKSISKFDLNKCQNLKFIGSYAFSNTRISELEFINTRSDLEIGDCCFSEISYFHTLTIKVPFKGIGNIFNGTFLIQLYLTSKAIEGIEFQKAITQILHITLESSIRQIIKTNIQCSDLEILFASENITLCRDAFVNIHSFVKMEICDFDLSISGSCSSFPRVFGECIALMELTVKSGRSPIIFIECPFTKAELFKELTLTNVDDFTVFPISQITKLSYTKSNTADFVLDQQLSGFINLNELTLSVSGRGTFKSTALKNMHHLTQLTLSQIPYECFIYEDFLPKSVKFLYISSYVKQVLQSISSETLEYLSFKDYSVTGPVTISKNLIKFPNLKAISFVDSIIEDGVFDSLTKLENLTIDVFTTQINPNEFKKLHLKNLTIIMDEYGQVFDLTSFLSNFNLDDIETFCFGGNSNVKLTKLPSELTKLTTFGFSHHFVFVPDSVNVPSTNQIPLSLFKKSPINHIVFIPSYQSTFSFNTKEVFKENYKIDTFTFGTTSINNAIDGYDNITINFKSNYNGFLLDHEKLDSLNNFTINAPEKAGVYYYYFDGVFYDSNLYDILYVVKNREIVKLRPGIQIIRETAFLNDKKLKKIYIPSTVRKIGLYAFYGCTNLEFIRIDSIDIVAEEGAIYGRPKISVPLNFNGSTFAGIPVVKEDLNFDDYIEGKDTKNDDKQSKTNIGVIIGPIIAVILVIVIGIFVFFLWKKRKNENITTNEGNSLTKDILDV